jgi:hypothetical protein
MGRHVARTGEMRNSKFLVGKPEGKTPLGTPGRGLENNTIIGKR